MKSYLVGLSLRILILTAFVVGVFVALAFFGRSLLGGGETAKTAVPPKSILLVLVENYEKTLLASRAELDKERNAYLARLSAAANRTERAKIEAQLKDWEKKSAANASRLQGAAAQKKELETRVRENADAISDLTAEKRKAEESLLDYKVYWNNYAEGLQSVLLARAGTAEEKETIRRAFASDNGQAFLTDFVGRNFGSSDETGLPKNGAPTKVEPGPSSTATAGESDARMKELQGQIKAGQIEVSELRGKMTVKLKDKVLFPSGSAKNTTIFGACPETGTRAWPPGRSSKTFKHPIGT